MTDRASSPKMAQVASFEPGPQLTSLASQAKLGERIRFGESLAGHASLRIGGPAAVWAEIETPDELDELLGAAEAQALGVEVVGLGSNTLFPDEGILGVVARLTGQLADWRVVTVDDDEAIVEVGAGVINAHLVRGLHKAGYVGAEFLALIPGTFGGAVVMNAGTKESELAGVIVDADALVPGQDGKRHRRRFEPAEMAMRYRHTELPEKAVVLGGRIRVEKGDVPAAKAAVKEDKDRRNQTQPYRLASVGSTFANPPGDYAGRLIEAVGLKGHRIGGAQVSPLHANFFINEDGASAADFLRLMALARHRVRQRFDVELRPEVTFVGFDGWERLRTYEQELEEQGC